MDWFDGDEAALTRRWRDAGFDKAEWFDEAARAVLGVLRDRVIRSWFENGSGNREAWCERRFDMLLGSGWVSGALDRVVIERNEARAVTAATILDFKTDAVTDEASMAAKLDGYRGQLALYKEAVARLTGLRPVDIRAGLVFLQAGAVRWAGEG